MQNFVYVTNNSDVEFSDGYNGVVYDFKKGATLQVPETVARHVFGWGDTDKAQYLVRLGWISSESDIPKGIALLDKFLISAEPPKKNDAPLIVERVPLPASRRSGGNVRAVA